MKRIHKGVSEKFKVSKPILPSENYDYEPELSYDWHDYLDKPDLKCANVEQFDNAPLHQIFHHLKPGLKVEVPNKDYFAQSASIGGVYWVAYLIKVAGYRALLRYEGYESDPSADFWMSLCAAELHPVGWCATEGKPLVPPKALQETQEDWKGYLVKRLTGSRTLPADWQVKVKVALTECPFQVGTKLELVDRLHPERVRPAIVNKVVGGRLNLVYSIPDQAEQKQTKSSKKGKEKDKSEEEGNEKTESEDSDDPNEMDVEFWCHYRSPLIYPVGWALRVGYELHCSKAYRDHSQKLLDADPNGTDSDVAPYEERDARPEHFNPCPRRVQEHRKKKEQNGIEADGDQSLSKIEKSLEASETALTQWNEQMKLEVMDPLDMNQITVGTVTQILRCGFLKVVIDGVEGDTFCFHKESPYLFPVGFCEANDIKLTPPKGMAGKFNWEQYLKQTKSKGAPEALFKEENIEHGFQIGTHLEASDMMEPKIICPATVVDKKGGRLLKIRFDGWDESFDQWADFRSPDIFPIGWCEAVGFTLASPAKQAPSAQTTPAPPSTGGKKNKTPATAPKGKAKKPRLDSE